MDFTEKERITLVKIKEDISLLSKQILENINNYATFNSLIFSKDITDIQSKLSTLSSYGKSSHNNFEILSRFVGKLMLQANAIVETKNKKDDHSKIISEYGFTTIFKPKVMAYISVINTIEFDFHKKRFSIHLKSLKIF